MTGRVQTIRSNVSGNRPTGRQPGELYVNWADGQIGVINSVGGAQDFVGVRFFSTTASYVIGDFVVQGGQLYRAVAPSSGGVFVPTNWSQIGGSVSVSDAAPANPQPGQLWWDSVGGQLYVWYTDPNTAQWVVAVNVASLLTPASKTTLGVVKVDGTTIQAAGDGTISTTVVPMGDNRIINGDMRIDQRNSGASGGAVPNGYWIDRWQYGASQASKLTWQRILSSPAPTGALGGFPYWLGHGVAKAHTPAAADYCFFCQPIEADMVSDFQWGGANAQPVTLSFWARCPQISGTFSGCVANAAGTRCYPFTFALTANAWARFVINIPGDTAGTWVMSGNAASVYLYFDLGCGSSNRGPANAWATTTGNGYLGANGAVNLVSTLGAQLFLTGVKLEVGAVATPFNRQSLAKSMADCQRYYQQGTAQYYGYHGASSLFATQISLPVSMRAGPTIVYTPALSGNATGVQLEFLMQFQRLIVLCRQRLLTRQGLVSINLVGQRARSFDHDLHPHRTPQHHRSRRE